MNTSRNMKKILFGIASIIIFIALAGIYKFNYLSDQPDYDVDGNKIQKNSEQSGSVNIPTNLKWMFSKTD